MCRIANTSSLVSQPPPNLMLLGSGAAGAIMRQAARISRVVSCQGRMVQAEFA